ncbi:MAG: amidohydrolase family protein [Promethearchaeota archaeon]
MKKKLYVEIPDYRIFDCHRHVSSTIEDFDANIEEFNIDKFCLMPSMIEGDFYDLPKYIKKLKPYVEKYKKNVKIFGFLNFSESYSDILEMLDTQKRELNIVGIKIHPYQKFLIDKAQLNPYFKAINEIFGNNLPIYIHLDWPLLPTRYAPQGKKNTFNKIVSFFPEFTFIMGHAGGSGDYLNIWKSCKKYSKIYIETSMAPVDSTLSEVVWKVGPERLLFGSNYPYCGTNIELVKILCMYKVSEADKRAILSSNWEAIFRY